MPAATKAFMKASGGAAAAIDFVGAAATFSFGPVGAAHGRQAGAVGLFGGAGAGDAGDAAALRAVTITGSYVGSLAEMGEMMALARQGEPAGDAGDDAPAGRGQRGPGRAAQRRDPRPRRAAALSVAR